MTVLPEDHLVIKIDYLSGDERSFTIEPHGTRYEKMLKQLKESIPGS
jgi:tRNA A37 threonylcarbamoyladenosine biosynthesis protein TsaE